jgi:hypothetical protein
MNTLIARKAPRVGYNVPLVGGGANSPADSTTYYWGGDNESMLHTVYANVSLRVPKTGVIKVCYLNVIKNVNGSAENIAHSLRINDAVDVSLGNMTWAQTVDKLYVDTLSQAVAAGDLIAVKFVAPAWVTNPTGVRAFGFIYIE